MEGVADAFAEYYSLQLSANIRRGQRYNAERALSNGHKIFGFAVDQDKRYIPDPETAPIVTQIFHDYASGVSMQKICDQLNAQGIRTTRIQVHAEESQQDAQESRLHWRVRLWRARP